MDAEIREELKKIADSVAAIERRLSHAKRESVAGEGCAEFPPMPFPAFDQEPMPLPI